MEGGRRFGESGADIRGLLAVGGRVACAVRELIEIAGVEFEGGGLVGDGRVGLRDGLLVEGFDGVGAGALELAGEGLPEEAAGGELGARGGDAGEEGIGFVVALAADGIDALSEEGMGGGVGLLRSGGLRAEGGEREEQEDREEGGGEEMGSAAVGGGVEDRLQTGLEGERAGHSDGEGRSVGVAGEGEKVGGVGRGENAGVEDEIVGSGFAFEEEAAVGDPGQGLPPVDGEEEAGEDLDGEIMTGDVGLFVEEDVLAAGGWPLGGIGGEEDDGAEPAEGEGHGAGRAFEEAGGERGVMAAETREGEEGVGELEEENGGADGPDLDEGG